MRSSTENLGNTDVYEDTGDAKSVRSKEQRAKIREERRLTGLKEIMGSQAGRVWMWDFLCACGLFSVVFNGNSRDYFQLGMRNSGMPVFGEIQKHCMNEYLVMVKENANV